MALRIDITKHELDNGLGHWLSPDEKLRHVREAIRKKHRDKWLKKMRRKKAKK